MQRKLSYERITQLYNQGMKPKEIAEALGYNHTSIYSALRSVNAIPKRIKKISLPKKYCPNCGLLQPLQADPINNWEKARKLKCVQCKTRMFDRD